MDNLGYVQTEEEKQQNGIISDDNRPYTQTGIHNRIDKKSTTSTVYGAVDSKVDTPVALQQTIGFVSCVGILIGGIIGSGIFISPKGVLKGSGSIGLALVIWVICGCISLLGSLAFAELGNLLPGTGGQYIYFMKAFHPNKKHEKSFWRDFIPFLYCWQYTLIQRPAGMAVQGMAFASYVIQLFTLHACDPTGAKENQEAAERLLAAVFIIIITAVNCYSNNVSTRVINVFTCWKLVAVIFIIISGLILLSQGTNRALQTGFDGTKFSFDGIATAFYSGLWAYSGWDNLNAVTREIINPKRDLLRSLIVTCAIITVVYVLANIAYFSVLSKEMFLASDAVAVDFAFRVVGISGSVFIVLSVACSIFGSTFGGCFTTVRITFAAAREGHMMEFISYIHYKRMTPTAALIANAILSLIVLTQSSILGLISLSGFLDWIFMFLIMTTLILLKRQKLRDDDYFTVPVIVPLIVMFFSLFLTLMPLIGNPKIEYIFVVLFLVAGLPVYLVCVHYGKRLPFLGKFNRLVQKLLLALPPEDEF